MDKTSGSHAFSAYLKLLAQLKDELEKLTELAKKKTAVVRNNDLMALDEIIRQEQAVSLSFRGLEQKQEALLKETGLTGVPLSLLPEKYPADLRQQARKLVTELKTQFDVYHHCAGVARNTLEMNLHEINKVLAATQAAPQTKGPGYQAKEQPEPPQGMHTSFRA